MPILIGILLYLAYDQPEYNTTNNEFVFIFGIVAVFFSITTYLLSVIIPRKLIQSQLEQSMPLLQKMSLYRTYFIMRLIFTEASSFIYIVFFLLLEHQGFLMVYFVFAVLAIITVKFPYIEKITETLKLSPEEMAHLN